MTAPKHPPRRLGFSGYSGGARSVEELTAKERRLVYSPTSTLADPDNPRDFARSVYLQRLAELRPDVLAELRLIWMNDHQYDLPVLKAWASRWNLIATTEDDWPLAEANGALNDWSFFSLPNTWTSRHDVAGAIVSEAPRVAVYRPILGPRPRRGEGIRDVDPFVWLARYQTGESYAQIGRTVADGSARQRDRRRDRAQVEKACRKVAGFIGLALRTARRGPSPAAVDQARVRAILRDQIDAEIDATLDRVLNAYNRPLPPAGRFSAERFRKALHAAGFSFNRHRNTWHEVSAGN